jgi:hypothetical protein
VIEFSLAGKAGPGEWPQVLEHLRVGLDVLSFDPRGLGETRMRYRAASIDDPALSSSDETEAYSSPVSGVLANYVYNAQLLGRPYVLEMVEDIEIVARFARERIGARSLVVAGRDEARVVAALAADILPDLEPITGRDLSWWAESLGHERESWPIHLLLPAGAFVRPSSSPR